MKKIIISLILFTIIYCTLDRCRNASQDTSGCTQYTLEDELKEFSCYDFLLNKKDSEEILHSCNAVPVDKDKQEIFFKYSNGFQKEYDSRLGILNEEDIYYSSESKNIQIENSRVNLNEISLSEEEKSIFNGHKTCSYYFIGRLKDKYESHSFKNGPYYEDIDSKETCFNAEQFPELKDIINCGYAEIKYPLFGEEYTFKTCFYIPSDEMPDYLQKYFKFAEINRIMKKEEEVEGNRINFYGLLSILYDRRVLSKSRKLDDDDVSDTYEITVEDKNGKIVKYSGNSNEVEIIQEREKEKNYTTLIFSALAICSIIIIFTFIIKCPL